MSLLKFPIIRVVAIGINGLCLLQLFLRDINDVIRRFRQTATISILKDLLFLDLANPMVVVLTPDALDMVLDVAEVVAALCCAIMDADAVQVIGHLLQSRVLVLKQIFLVLDLLLQLGDLVLHFVAVSVKNLPHKG